VVKLGRKLCEVKLPERATAPVVKKFTSWLSLLKSHAPNWFLPQSTQSFSQSTPSITLCFLCETTVSFVVKLGRKLCEVKLPVCATAIARFLK
jgi:hypothetical protein